MPLEKEEIGDPDAGLVEAACVISIFICSSITRAQSVSDYLDQGFTTWRFGKTGLLASPRVEHKNGKEKKRKKKPLNIQRFVRKKKKKSRGTIPETAGD
jgi:hypothetical protein